jgi:hypothetical protein
MGAAPLFSSWSTDSYIISNLKNQQKATKTYKNHHDKNFVTYVYFPQSNLKMSQI